MMIYKGLVIDGFMFDVAIVAYKKEDFVKIIEGIFNPPYKISSNYNANMHTKTIEVYVQNQEGFFISVVDYKLINCLLKSIPVWEGFLFVSVNLRSVYIDEILKVL